MIIEPSFVLLGSRNYVHSTAPMRFCLDFYKGNIDYCRVVFKKKFMVMSRLYIEEGRENLVENPNVIMYISTGGKDYVITVKQKEDGDVITDRIPYDEDALVGSSIIDVTERKIRINVINVDELINIIVAVNKKLLLTLLDNEGMTGWSVGKWDIQWNSLVEMVEKYPLEIRLRNVLKDMYTKSDIVVNGVVYGTIEFARQKR